MTKQRRLVYDLSWRWSVGVCAADVGWCRLVCVEGVQGQGAGWQSQTDGR